MLTLLSVGVDVFLKSFSKRKLSKLSSSHDVAIIGISCRMPGADDCDAFWSNLENGINSIQEIPADRWDSNHYFSTDRTLANKSYSKWGGFMRRIDSFDALFFQISPHEARYMDPQQRLILEETWRCIEDAGVSLTSLQKANTSVFIGATTKDYSHQFFLAGFKQDSYALLSYTLGVIPNRVSYFLNLSGESQVIDAACASSLVSVHYAMQSLLSGQSQYALAGGVGVLSDPWCYIACSKSNMLSPDGQCKTFDASANGYVPGEGVGVVLLERLDKAIENGHHIYGVIKGSAVHHTGRAKSLTAPRIQSQRQVIKDAMEVAQVSADSITYIEAHGTGTALGDPIEVEALIEAFATEKKQYCAIGSVKTNIGHLQGAAGIAGLIKVLMMLKHKKIPKTLNLTQVNPIIDFDNSPFKIAETLQDWQLPDGVTHRRAGVSSFGFGGVNSHLIVEEYIPPPEQSLFVEPTLQKAMPFLLSAKSAKSLHLLLKKWQLLGQNESLYKQSALSISETLMHGREHFNYRFARTIQSTRELKQILDNCDPESLNLLDSQTYLKEKTLVLRITNTPDRTYSALEQACKSFPPLEKAFQQFEQSILRMKAGQSILKQLHSAQNTRLLSQFINIYLPIKALLLAKIRPKYIQGSGMGTLAACVASGLFELEDIVSILSGTFSGIRIHRPEIALYDKGLGTVISPCCVNVAYCKALVYALSKDIETNPDLGIIKQSTILYQHQHTFKKRLQDLQPIFKHYHISLDDALQRPESLDIKSRNLVMVLLILSIRKMRKKWHLPETIVLKNEAVNELVALLLDGVLAPEDFAAMLMDESDTTYERVANTMKQACSRLDTGKVYSVMTRYNHQIAEISDPLVWIQQLLATSSECADNLPDTIPNPWFMAVGSSQCPGDINIPLLNLNHLSISLPTFLVQLWQVGLNINWSCWYPKNAESKTSPLPTYFFLEESHWLKPMEESLLKPEAPQTIKQTDTPATKAYSTIETTLKDIICQITNIPQASIHSETLFADYGIDSLMIMRFNQSLSKLFPNLGAMVLFEHQTLGSLIHYLLTTQQESISKLPEIHNVTPVKAPVNTQNDDLAITTTRQLGKKCSMGSANLVKRK